MKSSKRNIRLSRAVKLAILGIGVTGQSFAQSVDVDDNPSMALEEVIVTATRRSESVQDIPVNIAAISGAQLEEQGMEALADLLATVPGINLVDQGSRNSNNVIVRGLSASPLVAEEVSLNSGDGTVATYLGDIPLSIDLKLNDLERVEVLLGPQGTLYGAGTLGGAIRYIPVKPNFKSNSLAIRASSFQYGEADDISGSMGFTVNSAISDNFAIRGSIDYLDDSGWVDAPFLVREPGVSLPDPDFTDPAAVAANLRREDDVNFEKALSGRIAARWTPNERFDGTLSYYFQHQEIGGRTISSRQTPVPAGKYETALRVLEPNDRDSDLLALEFTADLGFAELTSATGYSEYESDGETDVTDLLITLEFSYETFPSLTAIAPSGLDDEALVQELRLVSTNDGPLSWIVGAFYEHAESELNYHELTPGYAEFLGEIYPGVGTRPDGLEYISLNIYERTESAFFGEISYDITEAWQVTLGGRYYDYSAETASAFDLPLLYSVFYGRDPDSVVLDLRQFGQEDDGFLFKFNTSYALTDDILLYGTISEGYRIGNANETPGCPDFDPNGGSVQTVCALALGQVISPGSTEVSPREERFYMPDKTLNYELGMKSVWRDGSIILNGAVYYVDWEDPQVLSHTLNGLNEILINGAGAESSGVELSIMAVPTERLTISAGFSYAKAELTELAPSLIRGITPPGFGAEFEDGQSGDRLPGSPEKTFSIFGEYTHPLDRGDLSFNLGYNYQSDVLTNTGGRGGYYTMDSFGIANAAVRYDADSWTVTLFAKNLFDEFASTGTRATPEFSQTVSGANVRRFYENMAPPRSYGVRFEWRTF